MPTKKKPMIPIQRNKTKTKITIPTPDYLPDDVKKVLAEQVIEFIVERTQSGQNVYGRNWSGKAGRYTKAYAKEKGYSSPVDLTKAGSMMSALKYFKSQSKGDQITIGYTKGTKNERKAEGNILGTYGNKPTGRARPFLDILKKDFTKIYMKLLEDAESLDEELERDQDGDRTKNKKRY